MPESPMVGRRYLDPGDRMAGRYDPPRGCVVLVVGLAPTRSRRTGPRTAWVRYDDGDEAVVPVARRLRRADR